MQGRYVTNIDLLGIVQRFLDNVYHLLNLWGVAVSSKAAVYDTNPFDVWRAVLAPATHDLDLVKEFAAALAIFMLINGPLIKEGLQLIKTLLD